MHIKQLKYAVKERLLGVSPGTYWGARRLLRDWLEPEMALLPRLCDRVSPFILDFHKLNNFDIQN